MHRFSKILCVIDPTQQPQPALIRAAWLAERSEAELHLLICYYNEYLSGDRFFDSKSLQITRQETLDNLNKKLEKMAAPLREKGLKVSVNAVWDHPLSDGIVRAAVDYGADVVFKDTHHHSALSIALFTNTDWALLRTCPVPLWLVAPIDTHKTPTIVAAIDPLHEHDKPAALDDQILSIGKGIAADVDGLVHAFHAFDPRTALVAATANAYVPVSLPLDEIEEEVRTQHEKRFKEMTEFHEIPDERAHLVAGATHEELPSVSKELEADLVIMGAVARNRMKRLFIGATAERTLGQLPCDLLVVKPDWFETPVDIDTREVA